MEKYLKGLLVLVILSTLSAVTVSAANDIRVVINGQEVAFTDQRPVIVDGRTLVPVRDVFEAIGFEAHWDYETSTALLTQGHLSISVTIGSPYFSAAVFSPYMPVGHGVIVPLDVPAQIIEGRTLLPLRALMEYVGYELNWDYATRTVIITYRENDVNEIPRENFGERPERDPVVVVQPPEGTTPGNNGVPIANIRHFLGMNVYDIGDIIGTRLEYNAPGKWDTYKFDTGLFFGVDGYTIMSVWIDYRNVANGFHFDGISGASSFAEVQTLLGAPEWIQMRGDAPPPEEGEFAYAFIAGYYLGNGERPFVRFYVDYNNRVIGIRYFS